MALTTGARVGAYEIVAPLGSGGMGEVYRARDTRLGRDVANDIFPTWSPDGSRLAFASSRKGQYDLYVMPPGGGLEEEYWQGQ